MMESKKFEIELQQPIQNPYESSVSSERQIVIGEIPQSHGIDVSTELSVEPTNTYLQECRAFFHHFTLAIVHLAKTFIICCNPTRLFNLCCQKIICEWRIRIAMIIINIFGIIYVNEFMKEYKSHQWQNQECPKQLDFDVMYVFLIINSASGLLYNLIPFMIIHTFTTILQFISFIIYLGSLHTSEFCTPLDNAFLSENHEYVGVIFFIHYISAAILACVNCWCLFDHYRSNDIFLYDKVCGTS